jgi:hypothetical protein
MRLIKSIPGAAMRPLRQCAQIDADATIEHVVLGRPAFLSTTDRLDRA